MLTLLAAAAMLAPPQTFGDLTIDIPTKAEALQSTPERKAWTAIDVIKYNDGSEGIKHRVTVVITDFAVSNLKPTPEMMLEAHEQNYRRRAGYTGVFAKRADGKAGANKGVMFYGYGSDERGNSKTL